MVPFYLTISGESCSHQAAPNKPLIFPVTISVMADLARTHETEIEFLVHYNLNRNLAKHTLIILRRWLMTLLACRTQTVFLFLLS